MIAHRRHGWLTGPGGVALAATWYQPHHATGATVLVVRSIGHDDDAAGHGMHHLASVLAAAGHPTVLLSLSGTGQSSGVLDGQAPRRWVAEVRGAAEQLAAGRPHGLAVVGFRVGALVVAHALAGEDAPGAAGAVLWHLPSSGRRVVRELRVMAAAQQIVEHAGTDGGIQIGAHCYAAEFLAAVEAMGAPGALPPALTVRAMAPVRVTVAESVAGALAAAGASVVVDTDDEEWIVGGGADDVVLPTSTVARLAASLASLPAAGPLDAPTMGFSSTVRLGEVIEEMHEFADGHLTGVLARPAAPASATAVLMLSANGPGDSFIELARAEARAGRASLRFDVSGFGMNVPRPGRRPGDIYTMTAALDVARGVAELQRRGFTRVVIIGFCAGGWAALRAEPSVPAAAVIAINVELYARNRAWARRRDESMPWLVQQVARGRAAWRKLSRRSDVRPAAGRWIKRLVRRGTEVHLVYDEHDSGYAHWRSFVERRVRRQIASQMVTVQTFPALGHLTEGPDGPAMFDHARKVIEQVAAAR